MNGPEHYRRAERLIEKALAQLPVAGAPVTAAMRLKAAAVHAQLAQVAVTYDAQPNHIENQGAWADVTKPTT